ncbi:MAG: HEXXH motif-containing putative peptide modification protein [Phreatobacter sp.]|nr:HEXXH motif-containing putative peptide modification protein [Phreatobacter sp.]
MLDRVPVQFLPDGATARTIVEVMTGHFRESLAAIETALMEPRPQAGPAQRPSARAFASYFDLLEAVIADDPDSAREALRRVHATLAQPPGPFLRNWDDLDPDEASLFDRQINADPTTRVSLAAPTPEAFRRSENGLWAALELFGAAAPEIAAEIRELVGEIVLVVGDVNDDGRFDGATAFANWGALFLNAEEHADRMEALDGLAHESAHALLFGHTLGHPLVENPPEERHASPLRADPRPLDGIFHATFVTARMHYAHSRVMVSGLLDDEEAGRARASLERCRSAFADGHATLLRHARMTPVGATLMAEAAAYMDRAA